MTLLERFMRLFAGRDDVAGVFDPKTGETHTVKGAVTKSTYRDHIEGTRSLGIFPLRDDLTVQWFAFDIDNNDVDLAKALRNALVDRGMQPWIERTKGKGYHVWCFLSEPARAVDVRALQKAVMYEADAPPRMELFPRQTTLKHLVFGNFLNLPYFGGSTDRRVMIRDDGTPVSLVDFLSEVRTTGLPDAYTPTVEVPAAQASGRPKIVVAFGDRDEYYDGPPPACVTHAMASDAGPGERHDTGIRLVGYWRNYAGLSDEETWDKLLEWNDGLSDPLPERKLRDCLNRNTHYSWGCDRIREVSAFKDGCVYDACGLYKAPSNVIEFTEIRENREVPAAASVDTETGEVLSPKALAAGKYTDKQMSDLLGHGWLGQYIDFAVNLTDAPRIFHTVSGLCVLAAVMGNKVRIPTFGVRAMFPNLYVVVMCPSGFYRKTTSVSIGMDLLRKVNGELELPNSFTPEVLPALLVEQPSRLLRIDEFGAMLASWNRREYLRDVKGLLTSLFDNEPYTRAIKGGKSGGQVDRVENAALTILGTTTIDWLQNEMQLEDMRAGFTARVLWCFAENKEPRVRKRNWVTEEQTKCLTDYLTDLSEWLGEDGAVQADFSRADKRYFEWLEAFEDRYDGNVPAEVSGVIARASTYVQKVAAVLSASDGHQNTNRLLIVRPEHLDRAIEFVEWSIARQHVMVSEQLAFSDYDRARNRVLDVLKANGGRTPYQQVVRVLGREKNKVDQIVTTMVAAGFVKKVVLKKGTAGRPPMMIVLPDRLLPGDEEVA